MSRANRQLIQIVPRLTPTRCGVSDQAVLLARELDAGFGIRTTFAVLNSNERSDLPFEVIYCKPAQLQDVCLSVSGGKEGFALAHVSGYAYSADGAPVALAEALEVIHRSAQFHIAGYFHELFAVGMPWKSVFWHSRRQKRAVRCIAQLCELVVTNVGLSVAWLDRQPINPRARPVRLLPVFSAVGESRSPIPAEKREEAMVVFGLAGTRERAYKELAHHAGLLGHLGIREILDIGPEADVISGLHGIPVTRKGVLTPAELATLLAQSRFGFLSYPPNCLAKSSVFAAYCAQGTIPVIGCAFEGEFDGLKDGMHLLSPRSEQSAERPDLRRCSLAAWNWYQGHRLHVHAETYAHWLDHHDAKADVGVSLADELKGTQTETTTR